MSKKESGFPSEKAMPDGKIAYLTASKCYYIRFEKLTGRKDGETRRFVFYHLNGKLIPRSLAKCTECDDVFESVKPGHFACCKCGKSYIDTDRMKPEQISFGGPVEII